MPTRFLIVDDLTGNRLLMRKLMSRYFPDARVDEAATGSEALECIAAARPDIMVLDVLMPDMGGLEVCAHIKADPKTRGILVLMVSGHATDTRSRVSGLQSGADAYLCKPYGNDEFVAQLVALQRIRNTEQVLHDEQRRLVSELEARERIEKQLEAAKASAEEAVHAKSEFLAHMSHEIRTPMNAVIGMTEILLETPLDDEQQDYVQTIHTAGETLLMVINDILDHSKIESGKLILESRPFRLDDLLNDAISMVRAQAARKGLAVLIQVEPGTPREMIGDTIRLRQILSNLLGNAVKFTERGEVGVHVSATRRDAGACVLTITVRDTGIGIPAHKMDRLFQSFSQVDASTTRRFGGTGLGLIICKRLAELMGGGIDVSSQSGEGSAFKVTVQLRCDRFDEQVELHEEPLTPIRIEGATQKSEPVALRVLVAEDNPVNRKVAEYMLGQLGCMCDFAEDGRAAVAAIREKVYDLVLMDIQMPHMDGIEAMEAIRSECKRPEAEPCFVALTAHAMPEDREKYIKAGMDDYISKPVRMKELHRVLDVCMKRRMDIREA